MFEKVMGFLAKLPNVHTVHDKITAAYNAWLHFYTLLAKLGLINGPQLTDEQALSVFRGQFVATGEEGQDILRRNFAAAAAAGAAISSAPRAGAEDGAGTEDGGPVSPPVPAPPTSPLPAEAYIPPAES